MAGDDKLMRWTPQLVTVAIFGLAVGLWLSTWIAMVHPAAPFVASYPIGFLVLWRMSMRKDHR